MEWALEITMTQYADIKSQCEERGWVGVSPVFTQFTLGALVLLAGLLCGFWPILDWPLKRGLLWLDACKRLSSLRPP